MKNLAAFTAPGPNYPPFFSVNLCENHVEITVRNHPLNNTCGDTATIKITNEEYVDLVRQMNESVVVV